MAACRKGLAIVCEENRASGRATVGYGEGTTFVRGSCSHVVALDRPPSAPRSIKGGRVDAGLEGCVVEEDDDKPLPYKRGPGPSHTQPRPSARAREGGAIRNRGL